MAEKRWTPEQQNAISARGGTVLVSAAAGSGKTAVLVERVVGLLLDEDHPVDADRLLVMTFSNAAALEMKQRIMARVSDMLAVHPDDEQLLRQQLLLGRAQIGTVHSFCISLIRENFQLLGISPNLRVADEKELEILRRDCASGTVERFHSERGAAFAELVELLSSGRDDSRLFSTLFSLYDFVRAHPFYRNWLDEKLGYYSPSVRVADSIWGQAILSYTAEAFDYAIQLTRQALGIITTDEAMAAAYLDAFSHDLLQLEQAAAIAARRDWDGVCEKLAAFTFDKLRPLKGDSPQKGTVQGLRRAVKGIVDGLSKGQFCATAAEFAEDIAFLKPMVEMLFDLVKEFDDDFTRQKLQRNLMDFSDMEQYAIALLVRTVGAGYAKTPLAENISALYDEVLVDEFQDTNEAQEIIFRAVSRDETNLFMVGDVKQSIYRFRQAMPELFLEKKKRYAPFDGAHFPARITLGKNFRSAPEVIGGINFFFRLLMSEKIGELDYTDEEALVPGAVFPPGVQEGVSLELLDVGEYAGERDKSAVEAGYVAERIAGLLEAGTLVSDGGGLRKVRPGDICILMRSPSGKAQSYFDALTKLGVPVWSEPKSGYLTTKEIAPVISLLRVIDNPLLDIDLAAVMMSALFGFTADEMAALRLAKRRGPLYPALAARAGEGDLHCVAFLETLAHLRQFAAGATADQVIRKIYELTDYLGKVQVMRLGETRRANLLLLVQYACDYHASGYKGLPGFVRFLDQLLERKSDLAPAASLSEQADVVRIMSIHRSKGLEFPVVFLCDSAKRFNKEDLYGNTLLHSRLGFACVRRDFELMKQFTTVPMQALRLEIERSSLSEELRVLYVALTRAKERLYITGTVTKAEEKLAGYCAPLEADGRLSPYQVRAASSYLDWLLMAAVHHQDLLPALAEIGVDVQTAPDESQLNLRIVPVLDDPDQEAKADEAGQAAPDPRLLTLLKERIAYRYPFEAQTRIPTKMAVSQISKGEMAKAYRFARRPAFLSASGLTGAQMGNALHKFMQFADYAAAAKDAPAEIERMVENGYLTRQEADAVDAGKLNRFFSGTLAGRIFTAEKVYRELRFLAEVGEETLGDYTGLFDGDSRTAIQGVADCVFIEGGQAVIVDYKSDYVKEPQELIDRYYGQLDLYRRVLGESLGMPVKECVLYSFALGREIRLDFKKQGVDSEEIL